MFENDITMCMTKNCPRKESCYRYTCEPDPIQSYSNFEPVCWENRSWDYFMDNDEEEDEDD